MDPVLSGARYGSAGQNATLGVRVWFCGMIVRTTLTLVLRSEATLSFGRFILFLYFTTKSSITNQVLVDLRWLVFRRPRLCCHRSGYFDSREDTSRAVISEAQSRHRCAYCRESPNKLGGGEEAVTCREMRSDSVNLMLKGNREQMSSVFILSIGI